MWRADKAVQELVAAGGEAIKQDTPPAQIEALRAHFRDTIKELGITLVVLIDDLDRCLPNTTISTLEAVRLFLFLPQTAFIIAADDKMIRQAVRIHFGNSTLDDDLVTNYFDKLIQIPLRVPPLGYQEVRAYLMLLYVEKSTLPEEEKERIRVAVCRQLSETWKGKSVDFEFMEKLYDQYPVDVIRNFDLSNRLAPLLASSTHVNGNPRLIKRFLNTLWIRMAVAKNQQVVIDEPVLAKVLLFERCASADAYKYLVSKIIESNDGQPLFLKDWENAAMNETEFVNLSGDWDTPFVKNWLALSPSLAELDLRAVVYVSRETMPIITASNRMSKDARDLFDAIIVSSSFTEVFRERLRKISGRDHQLLAEELISRAHQEKVGEHLKFFTLF